MLVARTSRFSTSQAGGIGAYPLKQFCRVGLQYSPPNDAVKVLALSPSFDDAGSDQLLDVVGDSGLGDRELVSQVLTGAAFLVRDSLEDCHPAGVGQRFGDELELAGGQGGPREIVGAHELDSYLTDEIMSSGVG
jgi:hypothetical protein